MPKITIHNLFGKVLEATDPGKTLLQEFQSRAIDWMHACGGKGRCTTCKVSVLQGLENFDPLTEAERRYKTEGSLREDERLACQAKIHGDIQIAVPEECKLPHIKYLD